MERGAPGAALGAAAAAHASQPLPTTTTPLLSSVEDWSGLISRHSRPPPFAQGRSLFVEVQAKAEDVVVKSVVLHGATEA